MNPSLQSLSASDLRTEISRIRRQLETVAERYRAAKREGNSAGVIEFLRQKSALTRQLFETQSALLLAFRSTAPTAESSAEPILVQGPAESTSALA